MKEQQRKLALKARREMDPEDREKKSIRICSYLSSLPEISNATVIFSYKATEEEVDLSVFHTWCKMNGKKLAFPFCTRDGKMEAYLPDAAEEFIVGRYGILAPDPDKSTLLTADQIDVAVVPVVAFDEKGNRCGHGKGYYDRYLKRSNAYRVGVAFEVQKVDQIVTDENDVAMDTILTERTIY